MTTPLLLALLGAPPVPMDLARFERELRRPMTAERAEAWAHELKADEKGANVRIEMPLQTSREETGRVAFVLRSTTAKRVAVSFADPTGGKDLVFDLKRLPGGVWALIQPSSDGAAWRYRYRVDGAPTGEFRQYEAYRMPPEMVADSAVAKGEVREMPPHASEIYPGTTRPWWVYLPASFGKAPAPAGGYNLIVFQDGQWARYWASTCLDNMIAKGTLPPTVAVFVKPGSHEGKDGDNRAREYDVMSDEYVRMIIDEILPKVTAIAPLTTDPARRLIAGQSSGGICAFTAGWERPESFGLVMSWIGSYVNIAALFDKPGGQNYPARVRRTDRKPIRVVLQDGRQDLDNEWGNWPLANQTMLAALKYKGYDVKWSFGNGFHSDGQGRAEMPDSLEWLFRTGRYAPK